mgnify:CR=1 FL=1
MKQHLALLIAYDGSHLKGWQKTVLGESVEEHLQNVLEKIVRSPVVLQAASRTDAGVHARGQVVDFFLEQPIMPYRLQKSANGLLPASIRVLKIVEVEESFHPSLDALEKEYHYSIWNHYIQPPHLRLYSWKLGDSLDVDLMQQVAALLIGTHHFEAFCNDRAKLAHKDDLRTLTQVSVSRGKGKEIKIVMRGNSFLYRMARNIVGVLVRCGKKEMTMDNVADLLKGGKREEAGVTAPAHGLFLDRVFYENLHST